MAVEYILVSEAAKIMGCSQSHVKQLAADGKLGKSYRRGWAWEIHKAAAVKNAKVAVREVGGKGRPRGGLV